MVYVYNEDTLAIWKKNALFSSQIEDHLPFREEARVSQGAGKLEGCSSVAEGSRGGCSMRASLE